jgi:hypothetical protein
MFCSESVVNKLLYRVLVIENVEAVRFLARKHPNIALKWLLDVIRDNGATSAKIHTLFVLANAVTMTLMDANVLNGVAVLEAMGRVDGFKLSRIHARIIRPLFRRCTTEFLALISTWDNDVCVGAVPCDIEALRHLDALVICGLLERRAIMTIPFSVFKKLPPVVRLPVFKQLMPRDASYRLDYCMISALPTFESREAEARFAMGHKLLQDRIELQLPYFGLLSKWADAEALCSPHFKGWDALFL